MREPVRRAAGVLVAVTMLAAGARAEEPGSAGGPRRVTALGRAEIDVAPDRAVVVLVVRAEGKSAGEAAKSAAGRSAQVLEALRGRLGPGDRAETASTSLQPVHAYEQGKPPRITGYAAEHRLRAITARTQDVGVLLDAVTLAADVSVDTAQFELADPAQAQATALRLAAGDARVRARAMAEGLGLTLGPVHSVRELGAAMPRPERAMEMKALARDAEPTQVLPPQLHVRGEVEVSFELAGAPRP